MMLKLLRSDWTKLKGTWIVWLALIGPFSMIVAQSINYGLRYDYLAQYGWIEPNGFFTWIMMLLIMMIMLGSTIMASVLSGIEHEGNNLKLMLTLPISKFQFFLSKVIWLFVWIGITWLLMVGSLATFGYLIDLGDVPWKELIKNTGLPVLGAIPFTILQLWLSIHYKNQAISISIGVVGAIVGMSFAEMESALKYLIWSYPVHVVPSAIHHEDANWMLLAGCTSIVLLVVLITIFKRKEIH